MRPAAPQPVEALPPVDAKVPGHGTSSTQAGHREPDGALHWSSCERSDDESGRAYSRFRRATSGLECAFQCLGAAGNRRISSSDVAPADRQFVLLVDGQPGCRYAADSLTPLRCLRGCPVRPRNRLRSRSAGRSPSGSRSRSSESGSRCGAAVARESGPPPSVLPAGGFKIAMDTEDQYQKAISAGKIPSA